MPSVQRKGDAAALALALATAAYLVVAFFLLRGIVFGGVPAFHHDWNWPRIDTSAWSIVQFATSAWTPLDIGAPNLYPAILPLLAIEAALVRTLGTAVGLDVLLLTAYVAGALGCRGLALAIGFGELGSTCAGVVYLVSPGLYDQLAAGHLGDVCVIASFPWAAKALFAGKLSARAIGFAMLATIMASVQLQGLALVLLFCGVTLLVFRDRERARMVAIVAATGLVANVTSLYGLIPRGALNVSFIRQEVAVVSWERIQSAALSSALVGRGYSPGYDMRNVDEPLKLLTFGLIVGLACLLVRALLRRDKSATVLLAVYAAGVGALSGLRGPAAPLLDFAFRSLPAASLFRELFHALPLVLLPLAIGAACAIDVIQTSKSTALRAIVAIAAVLGAVSWSVPAIAGTSGMLETAPPTPLERRFVSEIKNAPSKYDRFAVFPGRQPYRDGNSSGVDSLAYYAIGDHWPIFAYFPLAPVSLASDLWLTGDSVGARRVYERMSVGRLLIRNDPPPNARNIVAPAERLPVPPIEARSQRERIVALTPAPIVRGDTLPLLVTGDFSVLAERSDRRVLTFMRWRDPIIARGDFVGAIQSTTLDGMIANGCVDTVWPQASNVSADPSAQWVSAWRYGPYWPYLDDALEPGVVTYRKDTGLPFSSHVSHVLALVYPSKAYRWYSKDELKGILGRSVVGIALGAYGSRAKCAPRSGSKPERPVTITAFSRRSPTLITGSLTSFGYPGSLVFSDAFDPNWRLSIDGISVPEKDHFHADGFANGWIVRAQAGAHRFRVTYSRSAPFEIALFAQGLVYAVSLICIVLGFGKQP